METLKTVLHTYRFNLEKPGDAEAWRALQTELLAAGLKPFDVWGPSGAEGRDYLDKIAVLDGKEVTLESQFLFDNQWNIAEGLRVFDWRLDEWPNTKIKSGHYLVQTDAMREVRRNTNKCGYCGHQERAERGLVFCDQCRDSQYLKETELHLTRMQSIDSGMAPRAKLTAAEAAHLVPLYREAQIHGETERGKARLTKRRADLMRDRDNATRNAAEKFEAGSWILNNVPGLYDSWIFYTHTGRHCFGWRTPLQPFAVSDLLDRISEFPFHYTIKCDDGRTLEG